jgi:PTS system galactitol-specific IIA component
VVGVVSKDDALAKLADKALEMGWVRQGYREALLRREASYPTGLHAQGLDIAIPHADPEWTLLPSMVVGLLEQPAAFEPMGGQGSQVLARIILLLIIPDADAHIEFLRAISGLIEDPRRFQEFDKTEDIDLLLKHLKVELQEGAA